MRIVRWLSAGLLAVAAVIVPATAHAAPTAPVAPYTALTMNVAASTNPDFPGGASGAYEYQGVAVTLDWFTPDSLNLRGGDAAGNTGISAFLQPRTGTELALGTLPIGYNASPTVGGLSLGIGHGGCQANSGTVTITEITGSGDTGTFAADYDVSCAFNHYTGSIRLRTNTGFRAVDLQPGTQQFGELELGQSRDVTYTLSSHGTTDPTLGAASLVTSTAKTFSITANTCEGVSLSDGRTCSITVHTVATSAGKQTVTLRVAHDNTDPYEAAILLTGVDPVRGTYYPVDPQRTLDTRYGLGTRKGPIGPGQAINFYPVDTGQQKASAVVLNLTVDHPSTSGYLTLYPAGTPRPRTSSINYTRAWTGANLVTVPLPADGRVAVYNSAGTTSVIADVVGWYSADNPTYLGNGRGGGYHPTLVQRIFDTRTAGFGKLPGGYYVRIPVRYQNDGRHIGALSVTLTAVNMTGTGYLTTWNGYYDAPNTSTLNYTSASGVVSNAAVVPASYCPPRAPCNANAYIAVLNRGSTPVDVLVDINGYYDDGNLPADVRFRALASPTRIIDTRSALGTTRFGANSTHTVQAPAGVAGVDTIALDANVTAVVPTERTYLTVWPTFDNYPRPKAAVLNPLRGQTVADHAVAEVGFGNRFNIYNFTGSTDLTMDVGGTFELFPPTPPGAAAKRAAPRAVVSPPGNLATPAGALRYATAASGPAAG